MHTAPSFTSISQTGACGDHGNATKAAPSCHDIPIPIRLLELLQDLDAHIGVPVHAAGKHFASENGRPAPAAVALASLEEPIVEQQRVRHGPAGQPSIQSEAPRLDQMNTPDSASGSSARMTTLMIRNVSRQLQQEDVLRYWPCLAYNYDVLYLANDLSRNQSGGVIFINFVTHEDALAFRDEWHGKVCPQISKSDRFGTVRQLSIIAAKVQGLQANVASWQRTLRQDVDAAFLPAVFVDGQRWDWRQYVQSVFADAAHCPAATQQFISL